MSGDPTQMVAASANAWRDRALRAEAAAEKLDQHNQALVTETGRLRADLAEARQERDAAKDAGWDWMVKANERFARIGELEAALRLWYGDDPEAALAATDAALQPTPDPAAEVQT